MRVPTRLHTRARIDDPPSASRPRWRAARAGKGGAYPGQRGDRGGVPRADVRVERRRPRERLRAEPSTVHADGTRTCVGADAWVPKRTRTNGRSTCARVSAVPHRRYVHLGSQPHMDIDACMHWVYKHCVCACSIDGWPYEESASHSHTCRVLVHCQRPHAIARVCKERTRTQYMLDTLATFHLLMSALNVGRAVFDGWNRYAMLVTAAVFQSAIGPYVVVAVVGLVSHAVAAVPMFASVMAACAATCAGRKSSSATPTRRCDRHARAHLHRKRGRRAAPPCDTLRGGICCIIVQRRTPSCNPQGCPTPVLQRPPEHRKLAANTRYCCAEYAGQHCELQRFRGAKLQHGATCCTTYVHRGSDDRLVSGHGDAFADRRHRSGSSRAHRVDEAPAILRPTCRRHLMLCRTRWHHGMSRRLCAASLAACALCVRMCSCRVFVGMHCSRGQLRNIPPGTVSNGVCYLRALTAEDRPSCRQRRSCPCLVGTRMRPLHARATRSSGSAVECSHGVVPRERSHGFGLLGVLI
jgi:hypothetical protein